LTGTIPALTGLTNLGYFAVYSNQLTGTIPALTGLTSLNYFAVYSNQLTGSIPALTGLTTLAYFYVGSNRLTGAVPALPHALQAASLCPNPLSTTSQPTIDPAWNAATGHAPWFAFPYANNKCDDIFFADLGG